MFCPRCGLSLNAREGQPTSPGTPPAWGLLRVAVGIAVVLMAAIGVAGGVALLFGEDYPAWGAITGSAGLGVAMVAVSVVAGPGGFRRLPGALGLAAPVPPAVKTVAYTAAALGLSLGATALYAWVVRTLDVGILVPPDIPSELVLPGVWAALTFAALAVWTPLTEELFFRGFVLTGLLGRFGALRGMVFSAAVFSLFHVAPGVLLPIFVTGVLLAWLYHRTRSIWPCVAAHAGQNAVALSYAAWGQ